MMYYKSLKIGCSHNLCPATATTPSINAIACLYTPAYQQNDDIYPESRYGCADDADCWKYGTPASRCIKEGPYHGLCAQGPVTDTSFAATELKRVFAQWSSLNAAKPHIGSDAYSVLDHAKQSKA
ncbi:hypothetical protein GCK32_005223 [Trichostrongylus colubriformis]|uniref:Uncharacterized protein n=1 Tax=Trichostrongylus colubriformis TaxID=6319 RepID=A0AAN8F3W6_TRICO